MKAALKSSFFIEHNNKKCKKIKQNKANMLKKHVFHRKIMHFS